MSQSTRQSELFAAEDWRILYQALTSINFNASDPPSISAAIQSYIQTNYPEDFNDWIESSEFTAITDLLAWISGILAFKTDINVRENFLDTAQARESILRLARFLSYTPHRNSPATGLVKLVQVSTNDDVIDSFGNNLNNVAVVWNDSDNPDWFEQTTLILNNAYIPSNPFGIPLKSGMIDSITTQLYRVNNQIGQNSEYRFNCLVGSETMDFGIVNVDFTDGGAFNERDPIPENAFHMVYQNDGSGNASANTGFFLYFKQGTLNNTVYNLTIPLENRVIDISTNNINQDDVWVQTITDNGTLTAIWTKVPAIISDNITFNDIPATIRNIFSVITRDNDQVSLRFSDGRFGAVPIGNLRTWYRVSNGEIYTIRPQDMQNIKLTIPYTNPNGISKNLSMVFSLQTSVGNSSASETDDQIRRRAPQVYATQNRMVSGEDYNTFPLQNNLAVKLKAVNRVYSGHSRFIDLNDPTGNYQDTNVFSDDGIFYNEFNNYYDEIPITLNRTPEEIIVLNIQPRLDSVELKSYVTNKLLSLNLNVTGTITWTSSTVASFSTTGAFSASSPYFTPGTMLKFNNGQWVAITSVVGTITTIPTSGKGPVTLTAAVPTGASIVQVIPAFDSSLISTDISTLESFLSTNTSFSLYYNYLTQKWDERAAQNINGSDSVTNEILILTVDYIAGLWRIRTKGLRYVFESETNVRWFFDAGYRTIDSNTGLVVQDLVKILKINPDLSSGLGLVVDYNLAIEKQYFYNDGYTEPRRILVNNYDSNGDGYPDNPETFSKVINGLGSTPNQILFWQQYTDANGYNYFAPYDGGYVFDNDTCRLAATVPDQTIGYVIATQLFYQYTLSTNTWTLLNNMMMRYGRGHNSTVVYINSSNVVTNYTPSPLSFQWKHYAPSDHRIDPSLTNIQDMFVLTTEYDTSVRQWIANGAIAELEPVSPTELDLRTSFESFENYKMFSDQLVWRPVKYKFLFGQGADTTLLAQIKVVKMSTTTYSDGEVQSRVISAINQFFDIQNWDFGESFYWSELSAYIHIQLANIISSVVIVPLNASSKFGENFETQCDPDEIFISTAVVSDVVIITTNSDSNLRIS